MTWYCMCIENTRCQVPDNINRFVQKCWHTLHRAARNKSETHRKRPLYRPYVRHCPGVIPLFKAICKGLMSSSRRLFLFHITIPDITWLGKDTNVWVEYDSDSEILQLTVTYLENLLETEWLISTALGDTPALMDKLIVNKFWPAID